MPQFWVIATPFTGSKDEVFTRDDLKTKVSKLAQVYPFSIPYRTLKVGTLDSLMALSDELSRVDVHMESSIRMAIKTYDDLFLHRQEDAKLMSKREEKNRKNKPIKKVPLSINMDRGIRHDERGRKKAKVTLTPDLYVKKFRWNTRFEEKATVRELSSKILQDYESAESKMKACYGNYTDYRRKYKESRRKDLGTLLVRPLDKYVSKDDMVETELFTTLMLVFPAAKEKAFLANYELMEKKFVDKQKAKLDKRKKQEQAKREDEQSEEVGTAVPMVDEPEEEKKEPEFVPSIIPTSARRLFPAANRPVGKEEYVLYRIVVMKRGLAQIKRVCREQRYTVREYVHDPVAAAKTQKEKKDITHAKNKAWKTSINFIRTHFEEIYQLWIHIKAIRTLVEAVLRFGLPVNICASIIEPKTASNHKKLRAALAAMYSNLDQSNLTAALDSSEVDISGFGADFYPYVYLTI